MRLVPITLMVHSGAVWCVTFRYSQPARQDIDRGIADCTNAVNDAAASSGLGCMKRMPGESRRRGSNRQVMPDDHSELVPPLPIPNRTVKRLCADDSAATSVKVGHRQAVIRKPPSPRGAGGFCFRAAGCEAAVNSG